MSELKTIRSFDGEQICIPLEVAERITPTDVKLLALISEKGEMSISDASSEIGIDKGNVSKASMRLEEIGLLNREKESGKYGETKLKLAQ